MRKLMSAFHSSPWLNLICGPPPKIPRQMRVSPAMEDAESLAGRNVFTQNLFSKGENDEKHHER
jgi:hypothetical protein